MIRNADDRVVVLYLLRPRIHRLEELKSVTRDFEKIELAKQSVAFKIAQSIVTDNHILKKGHRFTDKKESAASQTV
jgi:hypothetical protein